jgi:hypothetical protein
MKPYRLDELAKLAAELGLESRRVDANRLGVCLTADCILDFWNLVDPEDTLVGFDGTPWHSHGVVPFTTGPATYVECDELDILVGLGCGELVVVSRYSQGQLVDRWLAHKQEPLDLEYMEAGEELRVYRLGADRTAPQ